MRWRAVARSAIDPVRVFEPRLGCRDDRGIVEGAQESREHVVCGADRGAQGDRADARSGAPGRRTGAQWSDAGTRTARGLRGLDPATVRRR